MMRILLKNVSLAFILARLALTLPNVQPARRISTEIPSQEVFARAWMAIGITESSKLAKLATTLVKLARMLLAV